MLRPAPVYIVTSPNQKVGKTLIARLLIEFFQVSGRALEGYDLQSRKPALAERFPHLVRSLNIGDTRGQMQLFDRLLADNTTTRIVDLGSGPFDQFFAVMDKIDFVTEARQRLIEPIVLFPAALAPSDNFLVKASSLPLSALRTANEVAGRTISPEPERPHRFTSRRLP